MDTLFINSLPRWAQDDLKGRHEQMAAIQRIWAYVVIASPDGQHWIKQLSTRTGDDQPIGDPLESDKDWRDFTELTYVSPLATRPASFVPNDVTDRIIAGLPGLARNVKLTADMLPDSAGFVVFRHDSMQGRYMCVSWAVIDYSVDHDMRRVNPQTGVDETMAHYTIGQYPSEESIGDERWALRIAFWLTDPQREISIGGSSIWPAKLTLEQMIERPTDVQQRKTASPSSVDFQNTGLAYFWSFCNMFRNRRINAVEIPTVPYVVEGIKHAMTLCTDESGLAWIKRYQLHDLDHIITYQRAAYQPSVKTQELVHTGNDFSIALEQMYGLHRWMATETGASVSLRVLAAATMWEDGKQRPTHARDGMAYYLYTEGMKAVRRASPYYWSPQMCDFLQSAGDTFPEFNLQPHIMPSEYGYMWFDKPLWLPVADDEHGAEYAPDDLIGVYWYPYDFTKEPDNHSSHAKGLFIQFLMRTPVRESGMPGWLCQWDWNIKNTEMIRSGADAPNATETICTRSRLAINYFCAALSLMNQVIEVTPTRISRPAYRRLERTPYADIAPDVRVVTLRRKKYAKDPYGGGSDVHWNYQWVVRGHWRQQYYPKTDSHSPLWVSPYVKGPEDAPLKPITKLFAVVQ